MKKYVALLAVALVVVGFMVNPVQAQYQAQGLKGGIGIGATTGNTDADESLSKMTIDAVGIQARTFLRYGLGDGLLQGELGIGSGTIVNKTYTSHIVPADFRMLISPLKFESWNPYLYAGIGAFFYKHKQIPVLAALDDQGEKFTQYIPIGLGLQFKVGEKTALEISGGYNLTMKDDIEYLVEGEDTKDGYYSVLVGFAYGGTDEGDSDKDGLSNKLEKELGTNKKLTDTDGDGLTDADEYLKFKTNPLVADTDGDGLSDGDELLKYRTSPVEADTDGDGLTDPQEVQKYLTDPTKADSDGDGLTDSAEINTHKTDPMKADSDGDGLSDGDEINKYKCNPLMVDSDKDGLSDGDEVKKYSSSPMKPDTDGDGLGDNQEVTQLKTNPVKLDTDGGTIADGVEVNRGTNPLDANDDLEKEEKIKGAVGTEIILEGIVFASGSSTIKPESKVTLDKVAKTMLDNPEIEVEIQGHTDSVGKHDANVRLSQARAESVAKYLVSKGVAAARMVSKGIGPDRPVASNDTVEGRQLNRRITFTRTK
jgi:outer membrane protein OmpA-like peptidoglycan-associated protein